MKFSKLMMFDLRLIRRKSKLYFPFAVILLTCGFLFGALFSLKTAYFNVNEAAARDISGGYDDIFYFSDSGSLQQGLALDDNGQYSIQTIRVSVPVHLDRSPLTLDSCSHPENLALTLQEGTFPESHEILVHASWAARNQKSLHDSVTITGQDGNAEEFIISGIYQSPRPNENPVCRLDPSDLNDPSLQGAILFNRTLDYDPALASADLTENDFSKQIEEEKQQLLKFAVPFLLLLAGSFCLILMFYIQVMEKDNRSIFRQLYRLGLSNRQKRLLFIFNNFLLPFCLLTLGLILSWMILKWLLRPAIIAVLFPTFGALTGFQMNQHLLKNTDLLFLLILFMLISTFCLGGSLLAQKQKPFSLKKSLPSEISPWKKSIRRQGGGSAVILVLVILQLLWQLTGVSLMNWLHQYDLDAAHSQEISIRLLSENLNMQDYQTAMDHLKQLPGLNSLQAAIKTNAYLQGKEITAIPDAMFSQMVSGQDFRGLPALVSTNAPITGIQTVQIEIPFQRKPASAEVMIEPAADYGVYSSENEDLEIYTSFSSLISLLNHLPENPSETSWITSMNCIAESSDPALTARAIENSVFLHDKFQVLMNNSSAIFQTQESRKTIFLSCFFAAALLILALCLSVLGQSCRTSLLQYQSDFQKYRSLGVSWKTLSGSLLQRYGRWYLLSCPISMAVLLLHPEWITLSWFVFLIIFGLIYMLLLSRILKIMKNRIYTPCLITDD